MANLHKSLRFEVICEACTVYGNVRDRTEGLKSNCIRTKCFVLGLFFFFVHFEGKAVETAMPRVKQGLQRQRECACIQSAPALFQNNKAFNDTVVLARFHKLEFLLHYTHIRKHNKQEIYQNASYSLLIYLSLFFYKLQSTLEL